MGGERGMGGACGEVGNVGGRGRLQVERGESQVNAEVWDCRDGDAEGVTKGLGEGGLDRGLEFREMVRTRCMRACTATEARHRL